MRVGYVAYGLQLQSSFALAGMRPSLAPGLPELRVDLVTSARLDELWSGADDAALWAGRLGDGLQLSIQRGASGDLLFSYGSKARFHLDADGGRVLCDGPRARLDWQRVLLGKVLSSIAVMRGYEALHASAVASPWGVVAVLAPSGMGKTTLALELIARGWPLFTDDVLVLSCNAGDVCAHPGTPHMNVGAERAGEQLGQTLAVLAGEHWLTAHASAERPSPVRMLCLLQRAHDLPLRAQKLDPSPLALAPYVLGLTGDAARERRRFDLYADLMSETQMVRVSAGAEDGPGDLADLIERELAGSPALVLGAAR